MIDMTVDALADEFDYLDELRASGVTNMFGAVPYLMGRGLTRPVASKVLSAWMETFDPVESAERRASKATGEPS